MGFINRVIESLQSVPMWIFMDRKDTSWVECSKVNLIVGWRLFIKSFIDWSCLVVPRKIRKTSSGNLLQTWMAQMKAYWIASLWQTMKGWRMVLAYGVSMAVPTSWRKYLSMNEKLLFSRMGSSSIPMLWGLWATGGRVLVCNFM